MTKAADRLKLLAGAAVALVLAYGLLLHWWWTAPMLAMGDEIAQLRDQELALREEIAQRPVLEAELARVRAFESGNPGFLPETNRQLATAALVQRLEAVIAEASPQPGRCQITARTPTESRVEEPFVRATVQVRLRCGMAELGAVLHALESGSPQLFVDNLDLLSRRSYLAAGPEGGAIDTSFDLYGYLKTPAGAAP
ncbi:MAG TPA: type II secretion system protein GspM [Arenimonas sp.]|uniref:type II secretion system protein GspM n=1 Tax=Arenimonas sp. TaxID=1872635 RepID=UPI002D7ED8D7|nr:type II secretion system protein GspM [Arenimonas sp.]HEU0151902.1 type II secretion system protein GspM [Arenimonas sp.]